MELYPYVSYMKFLLAGTISLSMYISVMIGGGMLYIDDKARGVHEGYLVTPITKLELVMGLNIWRELRKRQCLAGISLTRHWLPSHCGTWRDFQSGGGPGALPDDRGDFTGLQRHDVPDDGASGRSAGSSCNVRRSKYTAVFPIGRGFSGLGFSKMATGNCCRGPVHLLRSTGSKRCF